MRRCDELEEPLASASGRGRRTSRSARRGPTPGTAQDPARVLLSARGTEVMRLGGEQTIVLTDVLRDRGPRRTAARSSSRRSRPPENAIVEERSPTSAAADAERIRVFMDGRLYARLLAQRSTLSATQPSRLSHCGRGLRALECESLTGRAGRGVAARNASEGETVVDFAPNARFPPAVSEPDRPILSRGSSDEARLVAARLVHRPPEVARSSRRGLHLLRRSGHRPPGSGEPSGFSRRGGEPRRNRASRLPRGRRGSRLSETPTRPAPDPGRFFPVASGSRRRPDCERRNSGESRKRRPLRLLHPGRPRAARRSRQVAAGACARVDVECPRCAAVSRVDAASFSRAIRDSSARRATRASPLLWGRRRRTDRPRAGNPPR